MSKPEAVILDLDDTLFAFPNGQKLKKGFSFAAKHHRASRVLIALTARTHEYDYRRSHQQLTEHLALPFVGPFCRPAADNRYACDFKLDVYQSLSQLYDIVAVIDDDPYVLEMWRSIEGLEVVDCGKVRR